jgi:small subunit ribosomal protein S1
MKIILARNIGFCFGVKRALNITLKALKDNPGEAIHTLGALIHNPPVINKLKSKGVRVVSCADEVKNGIVIIPSHGLSSSIVEKLKAKGIKLVDATCPYVLRSQKLASSLVKSGYRVIIFGQRMHPEIKGIIGMIGKNAIVVSTPQDIAKLKKLKKIGVISQTTESSARFTEIVKQLLEKSPEIRVYNTLCVHTMNRQKEASAIAGKVDLMIVVGGHNSANTSRLYELCRKKVPTYHIESAAEIGPLSKIRKKLRSGCVVGIVSGTSTPHSSIKDIVRNLS